MIRLNRVQVELVRQAIEDMAATVRDVAELLKNSFGLAGKAPSSLRSFRDGLDGLSAAVHSVGFADPTLLSPQHAPMLRTVLQARRRYVAQDVENRRLNSSDSEIIAALDAKLAPFQEFLDEGWFIDAVPFRVPKLADFLTLQRLEETTNRGLRPTPTFEDKFRILYAASSILTDLGWYRDDCAARDLPVSVVFLDLDNFKPLNTRYGETRVDSDLLPVFMRIVERAVFGHGRAYRHGGDEIVLLLPNSTNELADALLAQLRTSLASAPYSAIPERPTISCGICVVDSESPLTDRETLERAARAKRFAKESGKNVVASFSTPLCRDEDLVLWPLHDPDDQRRAATEPLVESMSTS